MDVSIKTVSLFASVALTGLSAGLFYAWSVSVIPGTLKISDQSYLETMQSINRAILNPLFFLVFFGSIVALGAATSYHIRTDKLAFGLLLASSLLYLFGTLGVTGLGNVPLNNELEAMDLSALGLEKLKTFRSYYETQWNRLHVIRTFCAIGSFLLVVITVFTQIKK
ncbi:DUF1772 domain-containing protein [Flagellimonas sp.]|uniref:anthrone oxygenase family protein n=1 Tax=Flagellimonas sp. TaxID=2058762 RepID=UPI003BAC1C89